MNRSRLEAQNGWEQLYTAALFLFLCCELIKRARRPPVCSPNQGAGECRSNSVQSNCDTQQLVERATHHNMTELQLQLHTTRYNTTTPPCPFSISKRLQIITIRYETSSSIDPFCSKHFTLMSNKPSCFSLRETEDLGE